MTDNDERSLPPTQKRIDEFRSRGEIALSRDLVSAAGMAGGAAVGLTYAKESVLALVDNVASTLEHLDLADGSAIPDALSAAQSAFFGALWPTAAGALLGAVTTQVLQLGFPPAIIWPPKIDLSRPFTLSGASKLFSPLAAAGRAGVSILKLGLVGLAAYLALESEYEHFRAAPALEAGVIIDRAISAALRIATYTGSAYLFLGVFEYAKNRRDLNKRMRMTPEEIKREMRDQDGDPAIRRRRRQRMRELAQQRLGPAVKGADVVVVNPTEYAVAIRYRAEEGSAPRVVAKGRGAIAERIRDLARKHGVPIMPEPPLARLLYKVVPEGKEIPADLYQAVAAVLAYVYRLKRSSR